MLKVNLTSLKKINLTCVLTLLIEKRTKIENRIHGIPDFILKISILKTIKTVNLFISKIKHQIKSISIYSEIK